MRFDFIPWNKENTQHKHTHEDMVDHHSYVHNFSSFEIKGWKYAGLYKIRTHDFCDTGAVLCWSHYKLVLYP